MTDKGDLERLNEIEKDLATRRYWYTLSEDDMLVLCALARDGRRWREQERALGDANKACGEQKEDAMAQSHLERLGDIERVISNNYPCGHTWAMQAMEFLAPFVRRYLECAEAPGEVDAAMEAYNYAIKWTPRDVVKACIQAAGEWRKAHEPKAAERGDESAGECLNRLGDDTAKWAAEFRSTALRIGYSNMDEGWLIGWFANAIEHSSAVRMAHEQEIPDPTQTEFDALDGVRLINAMHAHGGDVAIEDVENILFADDKWRKAHEPKPEGDESEAFFDSLEAAGKSQLLGYILQELGCSDDLAGILPSIEALKTERDALRSHVEIMREALRPFANVAKCDIGIDESDSDLFRPMSSHNIAPRLQVGDLRRARAALGAAEEELSDELHPQLTEKQQRDRAWRLAGEIIRICNRDD